MAETWAWPARGGGGRGRWKTVGCCGTTLSAGQRWSDLRHWLNEARRLVADVDLGSKIGVLCAMSAATFVPLAWTLFFSLSLSLFLGLYFWLVLASYNKIRSIPPAPPPTENLSKQQEEEDIETPYSEEKTVGVSSCVLPQSSKNLCYHFLPVKT